MSGFLTSENCLQNCSGWYQCSTAYAGEFFRNEFPLITGTNSTPMCQFSLFFYIGTNPISWSNKKTKGSHYISYRSRLLGCPGYTDSHRIYASRGLPACVTQLGANPHPSPTTEVYPIKRPNGSQAQREHPRSLGIQSYTGTATNVTRWSKRGELKAYLVEPAVPEGTRAALREVEHLAVLARCHPHLLLALHLHDKTVPRRQEVSSSC